jgi:hypothetical protein
MRIPILEFAGVEAEDVIGVIARRSPILYTGALWR